MHDYGDDAACAAVKMRQTNKQEETHVAYFLQNVNRDLQFIEKNHAFKGVLVERA